MRRMMRAATMAALAFTLIAITFQLGILANHSWGGYHWARSSNPFTVNLGDNVSSTWDGYLLTASAKWNQSTVLQTAVVAGQSNPRNCRPTSGRVEVCDAAYGNTGWLGVAQIWITDGVHITQGTVKLNDTYFNTAKYNTPGWRNLVTCQEIGHTFGLDHQDENVNNANLGTCMDYTNNPYGPPDNEYPNQHDYDELVIIYSHPDTFATIKSSPGASGANVELPSEWGKLMKTTHGGRTQVFERDFGGERVVTFVIWA